MSYIVYPVMQLLNSFTAVMQASTGKQGSSNTTVCIKEAPHLTTQITREVCTSTTAFVIGNHGGVKILHLSLEVLTGFDIPSEKQPQNKAAQMADDG